LGNGDTLYTKDSHGGGSISDGTLVAHMWRDQLRVSDADFYWCVNEGVVAPRSAFKVVDVAMEGSMRRSTSVARVPQRSELQ
jgi:hypothetical protein